MDHLQEQSRQAVKNPEENTPRNPWKRRGEEDVAYQRQAQVTWWTLLGGIAVAALLTSFEPLIEQVQNGQWHLLLLTLATFCVIINAWVQTAWGALVLRWPITVPTAICIFFGGISLSIASLSILRPALWYAAVMSILLFSQLTQYTFMKTKGWVTLPRPAVRRAKAGIRLYWLFVLLTGAISVWLFVSPSRLLEIIACCLALVLAVLALLWQHLGMQAEKKRMGIA